MDRKDSGRGADVTFLVKGEAICAHSQILLARSDVFASELLGGMQESISKEIVVEDCEGEIFKAMLRFLYTEPWNPWNLHTHLLAQSRMQEPHGAFWVGLDFLDLGYTQHAKRLCVATAQATHSHA